jgi:hypothetical protein
MTYSYLDETLRTLLRVLINDRKNEVGYAVYDAVGNSQWQKRKLLIELLKIRCDVFNPMTGEDKPKDSWPAPLVELVNMLSNGKDVEKLEIQRNKYIHSVYRFWHGESEGHMELEDLKKGHKNVLVIQKDNREEITVEKLEDLAKEISRVRSKIEQLANELLTTA